ncbi:MAG: hypothetical protein AVDCRST_MAG56-5436 [uncultured Cytophagales bacterium]|uniref:Uncharacterized protein n=1 Tax=uncultured Cytophagales bacterium TaxID=158755 RepID=A0A6J4KB28_9SPHI|nr:MAG: hypothetical protein AVDCRST_MAG56-5436 [uncultured Cytophagales bacterium]
MGLDLFGSFWGNAKKNKPHLRFINQSPSHLHPSCYHPSCYHPAHYHPSQPIQHNPKPLKYAHTLISYQVRSLFLRKVFYKHQYRI